jgi:hypothetical protein
MRRIRNEAQILILLVYIYFYFILKCLNNIYILEIKFQIYRELSISDTFWEC